MKKIYVLIIVSAVLLNSCCDCSVEPVNNPQFDCLIRESTITNFNAELIEVGDEIKPGQYYSIHNFVFPDNKYFTGTLVNDERFAKTGEIVVSQMKYSNNQPFSVAILDNAPINSAMIGDLMILDVNVADTTADLKFKGELVPISQDFLNDDASLLCDYIKFNTDLINTEKANLSLYGSSLANSFSPKTYSITDISVLNSENENVTGTAGTPAPSLDDINKLLEKVNSENIAIRVRPGEIYLYKSISGDYFIVLITDISLGILPPQKGRVSIMFNNVN